MSIEIINIANIAEREKEKRDKARREDKQPHAPPPNAPGGIPEYDPEAEKRWRKDEDEKDDEDNTSHGVTIQLI